MIITKKKKDRILPDIRGKKEAEVYSKEKNK